MGICYGKHHFNPFLPFQNTAQPYNITVFGIFMSFVIHILILQLPFSQCSFVPSLKAVVKLSIHVVKDRYTYMLNTFWFPIKKLNAILPIKIMYSLVCHYNIYLHNITRICFAIFYITLFVYILLFSLLLLLLFCEVFGKLQHSKNYNTDGLINNFEFCFIYVEH